MSDLSPDSSSKTDFNSSPVSNTATVADSTTEKTCRICGARALGHNFGVISCESCKAFFRRNAKSKENELQCPFVGNCDITPVSRRFCPKCRLRKCLECGMKKDWLVDGANKARKRSIRYDDQHSESSVSSSSLHRTVRVLPRVPNRGSLLLPDMLVGKLVNAHRGLFSNQLDAQRNSPGGCVCPCRCGQRSINRATVSTQTEVWQHSEQSETWPNVPQPACAAETPQFDNFIFDVFDAAITSQLPQTVCGAPMCADVKATECCQLSEYQRIRLNELLDANRMHHDARGCPREPSDNETGGDSDVGESDADGRPRPLVKVVNQADIGMTRLIQMFKNVEAFRCLCQEDQISLLKGSWIELLSLRGVMFYDSETDTFRLSAPKRVKLAEFRQPSRSDAAENLYRELRKFLQFCYGCEADETAILIMHPIVLFCPTRPNLVHKDVIEREHMFYKRLLKTYLREKFCETKDYCPEKIYNKMLQITTKLQELQSIGRTVILSLNKAEVAPLLLELFDLPEMQRQSEEQNTSCQSSGASSSCCADANLS